MLALVRCVRLILSRYADVRASCTRGLRMHRSLLVVLLLGLQMYSSLRAVVLLVTLNWSRLSTVGFVRDRNVLICHKQSIGQRVAVRVSEL